MFLTFDVVISENLDGKNVQDGVRHYRVRIKSPIPNFIHFGKILVHFRYEGQPHTCCHCHQTGHFANACHTIIYYNCDQTGHLASECPEQLLCNFCESPDHKAHSCPFPWTRKSKTAQTENPALNNNDITPPVENAMPEENHQQPEDSSPPTSAEPLFTKPGKPSQDDANFQSISDETDRENDLTMDFPDNPPIAEPVKPSPPIHKPGKLPDTIIPQHRPTQPTIVTGKTSSTELNDSAELDFTLENDLF